eukprot:170193_1
MSTLPTIIEERTSTSTSKPMLCATFDFNTFSLGTQFLSIDELRYKKRHLSPNNAITPHAIQEYTSNHTTITIIKLSPHQLKKFTYAKIPTINNTKSIYLYKLHTNNNKYYLYISFTNKHSPKQCKNININNLINKTKSIKTVKLLPISFHGMALAIIYQKMGTKSNNYIIDGILYHAHNSKVYKHLNPQQDQKNKQETINNNLICNLANNHILDWGYNGLNETLKTLRNNNILFCGAGENEYIAWKPAVIEIYNKQCRIFTFGIGSESSGCPMEWNAINKQSGIVIIDAYNSQKYIPIIMKKIKTYVFEYIKNKKENNTFKNIIIISIHWGSNWGFDINKYFIKFAHDLIDHNDNEY